MSYQVRITEPDGSDSIVIDRAQNINYHKVINSSNEDMSFEISASDSKAQYIDYTKYWELWDTVSNTRLNRGPVHSIGDGSILKVSGPGRSQLLLDHFQTDLKTFFYPISRLIDDLRYENIAVSPSTKTHVWDGKPETKEVFFPPSVGIDEEQYMQYYGLSKQTKDNAIDDNDGYILPGAEIPSNTYYSTNSYWGGTDKKDSLVIDLGDIFPISKASILFPWWGGIQRLNNRAYSFEFSYSAHTGDVEDLDPSSWVPLYINTEGRTVTGSGSRWMFYFGAEPGQASIERSVFTPVFLDIGETNIRYFRILITGTYAWFGSVFDDEEPVDRWGHQCDPNSTDDISASPASAAYPKMRGKKISDRVLEPQNDCHASVVEFGAFISLLERNQISNLVKQRIKSDNKQIEYYHAAQADETITVGGYRKFEPGTFFRTANLTWGGATSSYTKFFDKDCTNCYASFNFAVMDDYNSMIYRSAGSAGTTTISVPRYARSLTMKGSSNAVVNSVDTWPAKVDPLSWGGNYAYTTTEGDYLTISFRGGSFTWWGTVPFDEIGATASIEIREKNETTGAWSGWTTLEAGLQIPTNITSEIIYDIAYNTTLDENTSYEIHIVNLDGGFLPVDSFGGWWEGSFTDFGEDNARFTMNHPNDWKQIYDSRFSGGSMIKTNRPLNSFNVSWQGDRIQIYSAKGRNHGKLSVVMSYASSTQPGEYDATDEHKVFIPGGDPVDGTLTIDLNTGTKGHEAPGILIFDSNNYSGWKLGPGGTPMDALPWARYAITIKYFYYETYMADMLEEDSDQFVARCRDCSPSASGDTEIYKFIYVDGVSAHERASVSSSWKIERHLDIISALCEALELEWDVGEQGLTVLPRIGEDTDIVLLEGVNTVVSTEIIKDGSKMASQLISSGADIEGLPLFSIVENRVNRQLLKRTVQRVQDYRSVADYFTLIGISRAELVKRREPEYRINVSHIGYKYGLNPGDTFILKKRNEDAIRVRINQLTITQTSNAGIEYNLECTKVLNVDANNNIIITEPNPDQPLPGRRKYAMARANIFQPTPRQYAQARSKVGTIGGPEPEGSYPPDTTIQTVTVNGDARPGYLSTITDSTWGTEIIRVSNTHLYRNSYSRHQAWNLDGSRIFLGYSGHLLDGVTYQDLGYANTTMDYPVWSNVDSNYMYGVNEASGSLKRWNLATNTPTIIKTFSGINSLQLGGYDGNLSDTDKVALIANTQSNQAGAWSVLVYDIPNNIIISSRSFPGSMESCSMSRSGQYVIVSHNLTGSGPDRGTWVYTASSFNPIRQISQSGPHADPGKDENGDDIFVYVNDSGTSTDSMHLATGTITPIAGGVFGIGHVSCTNYDRPGWAYLNSNNISLPGAAGYGQILAVKTDGSGVAQVFAFHHGTADPNVYYDATPLAAANRDGTKVIWGSPWNGSPTSQVYCFVAGMNV